MKIRNFIWCVVLLVAIDSAIKLIIYECFFDVRFEIIPNLFEFWPKFNDHYSYVNHLFGLGWGFWVHVVLFCFALVIALAAYDFFKTLPYGHLLLDIAFTFAFSGNICAFIGLVMGGCLDYIYLKPLFIFDLKDLYIDCYVILLLYYCIKFKKELKTVKAKDMSNYYKKRLNSLLKRHKP